MSPSVIKRQRGEYKESQGFRKALDSLRVNKVTKDDWALLSTRVRAKVGGHEDLSRFDDAMRIYANKDDVKAYNHYRMRELNHPVLLVEASHTGGVPAERATTDEVGNLYKWMPLSVNARIMLRVNLWVERRLFNGSMGPVREII
jgi:hypothetical protein